MTSKDLLSLSSLPISLSMSLLVTLEAVTTGRLPSIRSCSFSPVLFTNLLPLITLFSLSKLSVNANDESGCHMSNLS